MTGNNSGGINGTTAKDKETFGEICERARGEIAI